MTRGLALLSLAVTLGCTSATIHRYQQSPVNGTIIGGSDESLAVNEYGGLRIIPREDITEIDHPGTGLEILGAILSVAGAIFVYERRGDCSHTDQVTCVRLFVPAFAGLTMFFGGAEEHRSSEAATADHSLALERRQKRKRAVVNGATLPKPSPAAPLPTTTSASPATVGGAGAAADGGQPDATPP